MRITNHLIDYNQKISLTFGRSSYVKYNVNMGLLTADK